ncbi:MAG TPA: tetratricopeptide repeat protein [Candidatus Binatia bacterium]|nr:tetratricopeptide repeat protein [Candidatus Binatia bacterium]
MPDQLAETRTKRLEETVARDPSTALYLPLAECLREEGRVEEAIRLCEARKNRPGHGVGDAIVLGRCYLADGRLNEARAAFEAALALDRENVSALKALAGILAHEGRHARSVELYRAVCRVDPGDLESQTALHQITSGEYADVCPADVVVGQGDLGWHPVRLPREEEHLSALGLGLRTIESFGEESSASAAERDRARSFQELSLDAPATAERVAATPPTPPAPPAPAASAPAAAGPATAPADLGTAPAAFRAAPGMNGSNDPTSNAAQPPEEPVGGNRPAFEDWLRRLGGGS